MDKHADRQVHLPAEDADEQDGDNHEGDGDILSHVANRAFCQAVGVGVLGQFVGHEDHIGRLHGDIRSPFAHGKTDIGGGDGGSVIYPVAGHGDNGALFFQPLYMVHFFIGQEFGMEFVDAELPGNGFCRVAVVSR